MYVYVSDTSQTYMTQHIKNTLKQTAKTTINNKRNSKDNNRFIYLTEGET